VERPLTITSDAAVSSEVEDDDPEPQEPDIIAAMVGAAPTPAGAVRVGPGDDAAVLHDGLCLTTDTLVQGVHFDHKLSAADVGYKAVAVSVSDLASMGARPSWMLLSLSLPRGTRGWVDGFADGVGEASREYGAPLVGGDTTRAGDAITVTVAMGGRPAGAPMLRSTGQPGDRVWVTGELGLAGLGWRTADPPEAALRALRRPCPPLAFAVALASAALATAAMDLSDGLAADLPRLAAASGVGAWVDSGMLPVPASLRGRGDLRDLQLRSGEDYQLLFTAPLEHDAAIRALAEYHGVLVTPIGRLTAEPRVRLQDGGWVDGAFAHFGDQP
jgi:thiamine-monophosphate kinase